MILFIFVGILQVLKFEFLKFRILEILNFHPYVFFKVQSGKIVAVMEYCEKNLYSVLCEPENTNGLCEDEYIKFFKHTGELWANYVASHWIRALN